MKAGAGWMRVYQLANGLVRSVSVCRRTSYRMPVPTPVVLLLVGSLVLRVARKQVDGSAPLLSNPSSARNGRSDEEETQCCSVSSGE